jgi:ATP-dependent DNA helicase PIF1
VSYNNSDNDMAGLDVEHEVRILPEREVPCEFITGLAGTGKTYSIKQSVEEDSTRGVLSSTTGISAVNLGAITVHSLLRYSTTEVLRDNWLSGKLKYVLHAIGKSHRRLIVDECSMCDADQLTMWYRGVQEANRYADMDEPMGITLVGDLLQLPPVKAKWCFESEVWEHFAKNTTRLTKVWRQNAGMFLDALNLVREGNGAAGATVLSDIGTKWNTMIDLAFDGTTILAKNDQVSRYNQMGLDRITGKEFTVTSRRWGQQRSEWGQSSRTKEWGVPPEARFKVGAYVMVLANARDFHYVNGDCGHIIDYDKTQITIELARTGREIELPKIVRGVEHSEKPDGWSGEPIDEDDDNGGYLARNHYRGRAKRYVTGQVEYFPLRLAYASTVHKSQGLTLDRVQVDIRDPFFKHPSMLYVALSRCRTAEGLRIVGQPETFARHCNVDPRVVRWI